MAPTPRAHGLGAIRAPLKLNSKATAVYVPRFAGLVALPPSASVEVHLPAPLDQGTQNSCTGAVAVALMMALQSIAGQPVWEGSIAFNYAMARLREKDLANDDGAIPQDAMESLVDEGICAAKDMWYDETSWTVRPDAAQLFKAKHHRLMGAQHVAQDLLHLKSVLAAGRPFAFAIDVYDSFLTAPGGAVPLPDRSAERLQGGHALLAYAYRDDPAQPGGGAFAFQNSWSTYWGDLGRGTIPYAYLSDPTLSGQMWTGYSIRT